MGKKEGNLEKSSQERLRLSAQVEGVNLRVEHTGHPSSQGKQVNG